MEKINIKLEYCINCILDIDTLIFSLQILTSNDMPELKYNKSDYLIKNSMIKK
jgi:hypothetical protein